MPDSQTISEQADWPIFICYRQADGRRVAELLYRALDGAVLPFTPEGRAAATRGSDKK